jgi:hypothetical protein
MPDQEREQKAEETRIGSLTPASRFTEDPLATLGE